MNYPKVSIIVLTWNNYTDTKECIESLVKITYPNYEIVVVDNGSQDGSIQKIHLEFPNLTYIFNKENLGFTGGNNVGMKYAVESGTEFLLVLNNDTTVKNDFLEPLVEDMLHDEKIGIIGPIIYYYDAPEQLYAAGRRLVFWRRNPKEFNLFRDKEEIDGVIGCCMLIRKELIKKIGYFCEQYFLGWEEVDYCLQAKKAGYRIVCEKKSEIWHKSRRTLNKVPVLEAYYSSRNKLLLTKRTAFFPFKYIFYAYFSLYIIFKVFEKTVSREKIMASAYRNALVDFWQGNFGKKNLVEK